MAKLMSKAQLAALDKEYSKLDKIDPSSNAYKAMTALLNAMPLEMLKQIEKANIKFLSALARNRIIRKSTEKASMDLASLYELAGNERDFAYELVEAATLKQAQNELRKIGIVLKKEDGEYKVNFKGGKEDTCYFTDDLEDALNTGRHMAKNSKLETSALTGLAGQMVEPTANLIAGLKQKCAEQGLKIRTRVRRTGSLSGSISVVLDKNNEENRRKFMMIGKTLGLTNSLYNKFDSPDVKYSWNDNQINVRFTKQSRQIMENMGMATASNEELQPVAPSAVILASTVEKARLGHSVTTYELMPLINRLAHANLSSEEIADRFTEAFGDILLPQE